MSPCFQFIRRKRKSNKEIFLVILGLDNSGKTTTSLSIKGVSNELITPTLGFDRIEFAIGGFNINLYDLGGGYTIRGIWETYFAEVHGVIFVVDSSAPERLEECYKVLCSVLSHPCISGKPILLLANKRDIKDALDESELIAALQLDDLVNEYKCPCRLERCCALLLPDKKLDKAIRDGLRWLLAYIQSEMVNIQSRIAADIAKHASQQAAERKIRKERVRLDREERQRLAKYYDNTITLNSFDGVSGNANEVTNQKSSMTIDNTNITSNAMKDNLSNSSLHYKKISNRFSRLEEEKLLYDKKFIPDDSVMGSRDLTHQIQLASSIDLKFRNKELDMHTYHGAEKESLLINESESLHYNVISIKQDNNTLIGIEKDNEMSCQVSLSSSIFSGQIKDTESQLEVTEVSTSKTESLYDKNNPLYQAANDSVQCISRTPNVMFSLYEEDNFIITESTPLVSVVILSVHIM
ncbi:ADP-ribosylation factor-like protein 13B [Schistosoma japonicum]|nr:ADP-ribosylation factor-like protein 13B [Schistosoma japonicum]